MELRLRSSATHWQCRGCEMSFGDHHNSNACSPDIAFAKVPALSVAVPRSVMFFIVPVALPCWHPEPGVIWSSASLLVRASGKYVLRFFTLHCVTCVLSFFLPHYHPIPFPALFGISWRCNIVLNMLKVLSSKLLTQCLSGAITYVQLHL